MNLTKFSFLRFRICLLFISGGSHQGCHRDERPDPGFEAPLRRSCSAQGGSQGPFGFSVHAAHLWHEDAADGTGKQSSPINVGSLHFKCRMGTWEVATY